MSITRVNSASISAGAASTSASTTIPNGTGIAAGDLIIVCAASQTGHTSNGISVQDSVNNTPYTTLLETQVGGASSHWMQTFWFVTPVAIADGTTVTCTGYATATNTEFSLDVFRGTAGAVSRAVQGSSNASAGTSAAPALTRAPQAGDLVLTFCHDGSGTLTPGSPFTKGSSGTAGASTAIGYVLAASGSLTYASTWTLGTTNPSAAQTVAFSLSAWTPLVQPVQAKLPHPPPAGLVTSAGTASGRTAWNPGGPVRNPTPGPVFRQATTPARIRPALPPRGRTAGNRGGPIQNPPPPAPVYPLHGPVAAAVRPLPPRGRTTGSRGAPVRNPHSGPLVYPLHGPVGNAYRAPGPFRKGSAQGNRGAPVYHGAPRLATGIPYTRWATGTPATQWSVP